jgi:hypothetical protein
MNTHLKITNDTLDREFADLSRRSFLVGGAAAGHDERLGGGGGQHLCQCPQGRERPEDQL